MVASRLSIADFRSRLAAVQAEGQRLRIAAFVPYTPTVCGFALRPLTLTTYTHLQGWGNAFVCGGPITFKDVAQFIWVHHPAFGQHAHRARRRIFRQTLARLTPHCPMINGLLHTFAPLLSGAARRSPWYSPLPIVAALCRGLRQRTSAERFEAAVAEIREQVRQATHDFPAGGEDDKPLPHALFPQFVSLLVRGYDLDFTTARQLTADLPLRQLMQFIREIIHRLSQGKDKLLTPQEAAVWADYLEHQTLAAQSAG